MRITQLRFLVAGWVLLVANAWAAAQMMGKPTPVKDLPAAVKDAAEAAAPETQWTLAIQFPEGYKLVGKDAKDRGVLARFTSAGRVIDISTTIPLSEVPEVVRAALREQMPELQPTGARAVGLDTRITLCYEFFGKGAGNEVRVSADGLLVPGFSDSALARVSEVPAEVKKAANRVVPGVPWTFALRSVKVNAPDDYLLMGKNSQGRRVQVIFVARGDKEECISRIDLPLESVPAVAREALKVEMPGFQPRRAQACGVEAQRVLVYRFEGERPGGKKGAVLVSPDGKRVTPEG